MHEGYPVEMETATSLPVERGKILDKAKKIVNGERQQMYGAPENSFPLIAEFWTTYLKAQGVLAQGARITGKQASDLMGLYKVAREANGAGKEDNLVDACAYFALSGDLAGYGRE